MLKGKRNDNSKSSKRNGRIKSDLAAISRSLQQKIDQYNLALKQRDLERVALAKADDRIVYIEQAQTLVQQVSQTVQQQAHNRMASIVSRCLEAIFDDPYQFKIHFERKRGKTEARLVFIRDEDIDPMTGAGGGVVDVGAFALRLACVLFTRPPCRRVMILDEPFKHLKPPEVYGPRIVRLLKVLAKDFKMQFIMVQNLPEFQAGKIVEID